MRLILQITLGLIRDPRTRRGVMFFAGVAAMLMVFFGSVFLGTPGDSPWLFIGYWLVCAWLTLLMLLLGVYDLLALRAGEAARRRELKEKIKESPPRERGDGSDRGGGP